ncbi:sulfurtransferase [Nocardioides lianchengensis]|uniref:Thiosulfate/3-mercaptopyruvate sulfurtransferase n=1 Tax=Nocardioides lianchengensis TaxID=1045774 RepID=A0A1G6R455_9ACTN|nr:sulfurtransferase [Nocardioides lianchengensis]NYG10377.1 thiosulfate/3-mercaptopyruvate sulfurtransferase [Nocardioides lianchengensis]SDC99301.1 thiosulfate/3-mercaptopyruvate sulfurtransferase [Nocardioides lianchengensis]
MSQPLISGIELRLLLGGVAVLDVRYRLGGPPGREEYDAGHVPGAVYVDLDTDLAAPVGDGSRGRHPLPDPEAFQAAMRRAGVREDAPVVVYDDWQGRAAARAWWLLRHHGHPDVQVLDGGWRAWLAAGGETSRVEPEILPGDFTARPGAMPVVDADGLLDVPVVVDARAPERYRGEVEPVDPVAGHVPGAVNVPTTVNIAADGTFRSPEELRALYAVEGVTGEQETAVYCGSGVTAAHDVLALEAAGITAALYPGSWSEWVSDPARPVATSARP